jgi:hypothetical protein
MFYRFLSKLATQDRLEAFPVPVPSNSDLFAIDSSTETCKKVLMLDADEQGTRRTPVD